jgi:hypothetical protein
MRRLPLSRFLCFDVRASWVLYSFVLLPLEDETDEYGMYEEVENGRVRIWLGEGWLGYEGMLWGCGQVSL